jgi:ferredoxin-thioredoxin reductase catalytic subunit
MEKTKYEMKAEVETANVLPKTLVAETQMMPMGGAQIPMYAVHGRDDADRKVWCCTFVDSDEAMAWVQASRVFGRAVRGAVIAQQEAPSDGEKTEPA